MENDKRREMGIKLIFFLKIKFLRANYIMTHGKRWMGSN